MSTTRTNTTVRRAACIVFAGIAAATGVAATQISTANATIAPPNEITCPAMPETTREYADAFIVAWGLGDRARMACYATPESVDYALRYTEALGPGWAWLRVSGEQQTRYHEYGSPNGKTVAGVSVDQGSFGLGREPNRQAIVFIRVG